MSTMRIIRRVSSVADLRHDVRGLSTVEYIIILVLIAVLAITVWRQFGQAVEENVRESTTDVANLRTGGS